MKKHLLQFQVVLICLILCTLFSCHQYTSIKKVCDERSLTIVVDNFISSEPLRTIAPDPFTVTNLQVQGQYQLKLSGTTGRMSFSERVITLSNGRVTLPDVAPGLWELTLTAYDRTGTTALLRGRATVQVHAVGNAECRFLLEPVGTGTGTINLTINWNQSDRGFVQSSYPTQLTVAIALYYPKTDIMVANSRAIWTRSNTNTAAISTSLQYTGFQTNQVTQLPVGEYELRFTITGGNLPAGTTVQWSDNLYVEAGRVTTGNITIPQLIMRPAAPPYLVSSSNDAEDNGRFTVTLGWGDAPIYNNKSYNLEILSFTSGTMPTTDSTWSAAVNNGGKVYSYDELSIKRTAVTNPYPVAHFDGGLGKNDISVDLEMTLQANRNYCARIRSSNDSGPSDWVYLQNLLMSQPIIASHTSTKADKRVWAGGRLIDTWNVTLAIGQTTWGNNYELSWLRLRAGDSLSNYIYDDAAWLAYQATDGQGKRTVAKTDTITVDQLDKDMKFVFRIRALSPAGNSEWFYYSQETVQLP